MFPTLDQLLGFGPAIDTHVVFEGIGMLVGGGVFLLQLRRYSVRDPRIWALVAGAMMGAAVLSRLGTWAQHLDPSQNLSLVEQLMRGNASILSSLVGAWLGVHIAKRLVRYPDRTGDLFAPAVALALVIGRFGCFFTERPGTPTGGDWGIVLDAETAARLGSPAGVGLHPSFLYEIAFHLVAFAVLWFWLRRGVLAPGEMLTVYIGFYAVFRFFVEFVRGNDVAFAGLTRPQLFLLFTIPLFVARVVWLARRGRLFRSVEVRDVVTV
jgi:phosphatidylglycerol---prolipoprotein diacylglyceryl transferase